MACLPIGGGRTKMSFNVPRSFGTLKDNKGQLLIVIVTHLIIDKGFHSLWYVGYTLSDS